MGDHSLALQNTDVPNGFQASRVHSLATRFRHGRHLFAMTVRKGDVVSGLANRAVCFYSPAHASTTAGKRKGVIPNQ